MKKFITMVLTVIVCGAIFMGIVNFVDNIEVYSATHKYQLMNDIEREDPDAIKIFNEYIEKDVYLYNGPITINAMADKYDLDSDELTKEYKNSGYKSVQDFFDEVISKRVK